MPSYAAMAPIAQHRGGDPQLAGDRDQRPTAARQQGNRLPLELIRKMTPFLAHSTPFRSRRSLAKVSTNAGEAQVIRSKAQENSTLIETLRAIQTLKLFNRENERESQWLNRYASVINAAVRIGRAKILFSTLNEAIFGIENILT